MFEKLLLAGTITFSLNLFIGMSVQSTQQPTVTAQAANTAQAASTAQTANHSVYIANAQHDKPSLWSLFQ